MTLKDFFAASVTRAINNSLSVNRHGFMEESGQYNPGNMPDRMMMILVLVSVLEA